MADAAFNCLALSAFAMAFNLPLGRLLLVVGFGLFCAECYRSRRIPNIPGIVWFSIAFFLIASISAFHGVNPAGTWSKLRKLIWYIMGIFAYASLSGSPWRLGVIMNSFAAGSGVLAVMTLVKQFTAAFKASAGGAPFVAALTDAGSMTDAQRLMAGIIVTAAVVLVFRQEGRRCLIWGALLLVQALALLITFKRGSWMCLVLVGGVILAVKSDWRYVAGLVAAVVLVALLPPVRSRLAGLGSEFSVEKGGRLTMWMKVAPELHRQHPWLGVGWRAMTNEMMVEIAPNVERNRDHLHSNIAEVLVETGWMGFVIYVAWMAKALWNSAAFYFGVIRRASEGAFYSLALLAVLCALLLNGIVEFNFADGEIVLIYSMVMGCAVAGLERLEFRPMGVRLQVH